MTYIVAVRPRTEQELLRLYNYIADNSGEPRARAYLMEVEGLIRSLSEFPARGAPREDLGAGIRLLTLNRRLALAFTVSGEIVEVVGVFYGGRDIDTLISPRLGEA